MRASPPPSRVARVGAPVVILERHRNDEKNGRRRASLTVSIPTRASRKPQPAAASLPKRALSGLVAASPERDARVGRPGARRDPLSPIDQDPDRCERAFVGNTIGQANAVSDRILDLRKCAYDGKDLSTKTLSGALMVDASFKGANLTEVVMSKAVRARRRLHRRRLHQRRRRPRHLRRRRRRPTPTSATPSSPARRTITPRSRAPPSRRRSSEGGRQEAVRKPDARGGHQVRGGVQKSPPAVSARAYDTGVRRVYGDDRRASA